MSDKIWHKKDKIELVKDVRNKATITDIAKKHGTTIENIENQIKKLTDRGIKLNKHGAENKNSHVYIRDDLKIIDGSSGRNHVANNLNLNVAKNLNIADNLNNIIKGGNANHNNIASNLNYAKKSGTANNLNNIIKGGNVNHNNVASNLNIAKGGGRDRVVNNLNITKGGNANHNNIASNAKGGGVGCNDVANNLNITKGGGGHGGVADNLNITKGCDNHVADNLNTIKGGHKKENDRAANTKLSDIEKLQKENKILKRVIEKLCEEIKKKK